jgi:hypothetical protein
VSRKRRVVLTRSQSNGRWYWHWAGKNGKVIGQQAGGLEGGYGDKRDAVRAIEEVTGGRVTITYSSRGRGGFYQQGTLRRWEDDADRQPVRVEYLVEVLGDVAVA